MLIISIAHERPYNITIEVKTKRSSVSNEWKQTFNTAMFALIS